MQNEDVSESGSGLPYILFYKDIFTHFKSHQLVKNNKYTHEYHFHRKYLRFAASMVLLSLFLSLIELLSYQFIATTLEDVAPYIIL